MSKKFIWIIATCFLLACGQAKEKKFDQDSYEKNKETLADKEKNNPIKFLSVKVHNRKNLIGQTVVKGSINNNATICTYKDVEIRFSFYSKTGTRLTEELETIYESVTPGKSIDFKTKYFAPKGTDSVSAKVESAKVN
ncbi:hypothetical protein ACI6Q2_05330 [Chitinophagaceae bacterium LWZ2-11]